MRNYWGSKVGIVFAVAICLAWMGDALAHTTAKSASRQQVLVDDVFQTASGQYVVLLKTHSSPVRYLPIWIGEREALAIRLRLERQAPPRPLTLNLTESILRSSKAHLQSVTIDEVHGGVFLGKIRLKQKGRVWSLDARPSDAIALALGQGSPIWVAKTVLDQAAFRSDLLEKSLQPADGAEPGGPVETPVQSYEETL